MTETEDRPKASALSQFLIALSATLLGGLLLFGLVTGQLDDWAVSLGSDGQIASDALSDDDIYDGAELGMAIDDFMDMAGREPDDQQQTRMTGYGAFYFYYGEYQFVFEFDPSRHEGFTLTAMNSF